MGDVFVLSCLLLVYSTLAVGETGESSTKARDDGIGAVVAHLVEQQSSVNAKLQALETSLRATETALAASNRELGVTKKQLAATDTKLLVTQSEMKATMTKRQTRSQGSSFVRWGRKSCPRNTIRVYVGRPFPKTAMPLVEVFDKLGNNLKLEYIDGVFFPRPPLTDDLQTHLDHIRDLDIRDDDVMICAYPKCGTHWVWEMVQMLRAGHVTYDARAKEALMIDFMPKDTLDALPSPRTLNTHFLFRHLPKQVAQKKTKMILLNRDPRDVAVSWYNHTKGKQIAAYRGDFADFLPLFLHGTVAFGSWFEFTKDWERITKRNPDLSVLSLYYEDMKKSPVQTVRQLARFLEVSVSDELCADIAKACEFGQLKAAHTREKTNPLHFTWREGHPGIDRKGKTGDWKNWFTVGQLEQFDKFYSSSMAGTNVFNKYVTGSS